MADATVKIGADTSGVDRKLKGLGKSFQKLGKVAKWAFVGIGAGLGVVLKKSVGVSASFEQTQVAFETMLGSAEKAKEVLEELTKFSTITPFEPDQVYQAGRQLLAFGVTAEELIPTLQKLGNLSAGTGKDFNELAAVFGKIKTKGKAQAEELNQLAEAGIPIIQELAKMYGVTAAEVFDAGSEGKIAFRDIEKAFGNMTDEGSMFGGMMAKQSKTLLGIMSTLKGNITETGKSIGQKILPKLVEWAEGLNTILTGSKEVKKVHAGLQARELGVDISEFDLKTKSGQEAYQQAMAEAVIGGARRKFLGQAPKIGETQLIDDTPTTTEDAETFTKEYKKKLAKKIKDLKPGQLGLGGSAGGASTFQDIDKELAAEKEQAQKTQDAKAKQEKMFASTISEIQMEIEMQKLKNAGLESEANLKKQIFDIEKRMGTKLSEDEIKTLREKQNILDSLNKVEGEKGTTALTGGARDTTFSDALLRIGGKTGGKGQQELVNLDRKRNELISELIKVSAKETPSEMEIVI